MYTYIHTYIHTYMCSNLDETGATNERTHARTHARTHFRGGRGCGLACSKLLSAASPCAPPPALAYSSATSSVAAAATPRPCLPGDVPRQQVLLYVWPQLLPLLVGQALNGTLGSLLSGGALLLTRSSSAVAQLLVCQLISPAFDALVSSELHEDFFCGPLVLLRNEDTTGSSTCHRAQHTLERQQRQQQQQQQRPHRGIHRKGVQQGSDGKIDALQRRLDEKLFSRLFRKAETPLYQGKLWATPHVVGASRFLGEPVPVPSSSR